MFAALFQNAPLSYCVFLKHMQQSGIKKMQIIHRLAVRRPHPECEYNGWPNAITNLDIHTETCLTELVSWTRAVFPQAVVSLGEWAWLKARCVFIWTQESQVNNNNNNKNVDVQSIPRRTLEDQRHPVGSADFDILRRPRTALP